MCFRIVIVFFSGLGLRIMVFFIVFLIGLLLGVLFGGNYRVIVEKFGKV